MNKDELKKYVDAKRECFLMEARVLLERNKKRSVEG